MRRLGAPVAIALALSLTAAPSAADGIPPHPAVVDIGIDERRGASVPDDIALVDASGREVRLGDYFHAGRPVLLVLVYSECAMLCNLVLRGLAEVVAEMESRPGTDYQLLTVSIDPEASPYIAARQQAAVSRAAGVTTEQWPFLTGDQTAIDTLADALGFRYARDPRSGQIAHPSVLFVLTPRGTVAHYLHGVRYARDDVEEAVAGARAERVADRSTPFEAALSCFRFDPTRRQHGPLVYGFLRGLAVALLVALGAGALLLRRKERRP